MTELSLESSGPGNIPNYSNSVPVFALKGSRGGTVVYTIQVPIGLALDMFPTPDPNIKFPNNRKIKVSHAEGFGKYWEKTPEGWGCPAGLLSVRNDFGQKWQPSGQGNAVSVGVLNLPRSLQIDSEILDIQHRLYGWYLKRQELQNRLNRVREDLRAAREQGEKDLIKYFEKQVDEIHATLERFNSETITVEIQVLTEVQHRILFGMIADKALPITASQIADFDTSNPLNHAAHVAAEHDLLSGRIDWEATNAKDTARRVNPNVISGAALVNIVRAIVANQLSGRLSERREQELAANEAKYVGRVTQFFDVLCEAFPEVNAVKENKKSPADLRSTSLLGSPTILRVLAGAYASLTAETNARGQKVNPRMTPAQVGEFFAKLAPFMDIPVTNQGWLETGNFPPTGPGLPDVNAPSSRNQDLKALAKKIEEWALGVEAFPFK